MCGVRCFLHIHLLQQKHIASVMEAEQEYARTGEAIDFEDMMAEFSKEFNWNC